MEKVRVTFYRADGTVIVAADVTTGAPFNVDGPLLTLRMRVDALPGAPMMDYESIPRHVRAAQYTGANTTEITTLAGEKNVTDMGGWLQVQTPAEPHRWRDMHPGDWIIRDETGWTTISSDTAFTRNWRAAT